MLIKHRGWIPWFNIFFDISLFRFPFEEKSISINEIFMAVVIIVVLLLILLPENERKCGALSEFWRYVEVAIELVYNGMCDGKT